MFNNILPKIIKYDLKFNLGNNLNWSILSCNPNLTVKIVKNFYMVGCDKFNWFNLSFNKNFINEFINTYFNDKLVDLLQTDKSNKDNTIFECYAIRHLHWNLITFECELTKQFIDIFMLLVSLKLILPYALQSDAYWNMISDNTNLSLEVIDTYKDNLNWSKISDNILTIDLIKKYWNKLNLIKIARNSSLTLELLDCVLEHTTKNNKLNLYYLSENTTLIYELIKKYQNNTNWNKFSKYRYLSLELIKLYLLEKNYQFYKEGTYKPKEFFKKDSDDIKNNWNFITRGINLNIKFLKTYKDNLNWDIISSRSNIDSKIILEYLKIRSIRNKLNWDHISKVVDINMLHDPIFLSEFGHKLNWKYLSSNINFIPDIINYYISLKFNQSPRFRDMYLQNPENATMHFQNIILFLKLYSFSDKVYIDWQEFSKNPGLNLEIIKGFGNGVSENKLNWEHALSNTLNWEHILNNHFNLHPQLLAKNKKIYADQLKQEIPEMIIKIYNRSWKKIFTMDVIHLLHLRFRDFNNGVRVKLV